MNTVIHYPDYFAAAYPCCEAYSFYEFDKKEEDGEEGPVYEISDRLWLTEEKINTIKNLPIWFIVSADDAVVDPQKYVLPTYQALLQAGSQNSWLSIFENVVGTDNPGGTYAGHPSWIYLLNDQVTRVQDKEAIRTSEDDEMFGTTPTNDGGGAMKADECSGIFEWLNMQSK